MKKSVILPVSALLLVLLALAVWFARPDPEVGTADLAATDPEPEMSLKPAAAPVNSASAPAPVSKTVMPGATRLLQKPAPTLSPAMIEAMREVRQPAPGEGEVIRHPDGSEEINLGNRYRSIAIATVGEDGKVHVDYHGEKYIPEDKPVTGNAASGDPQP